MSEQKMKAVVCHDFGPLSDLTVEDIAVPDIRPDEVLIDVDAAGVNFPDALLVQGLYQIQPETPFTPGCEVAGTVIQAGDRVSHLSVGQRVVGVCQIGGYAQKVAINAAQVMPLPE